VYFDFKCTFFKCTSCDFESVNPLRIRLLQIRMLYSRYSVTLPKLFSSTSTAPNRVIDRIFDEVNLVYSHYTARDHKYFVAFVKYASHKNV